MKVNIELIPNGVDEVNLLSRRLELLEANHSDAVNKFSTETRQEFERIRAMDLPQEEIDKILQLYWGVRRWSHPNAVLGAEYSDGRK